VTELGGIIASSDNRKVRRAEKGSDGSFHFDSVMFSKLFCGCAVGWWFLEAGEMSCGMSGKKPGLYKRICVRGASGASELKRAVCTLSVGNVVSRR
jgi:hypothetical protein